MQPDVLSRQVQDVVSFIEKYNNLSSLCRIYGRRIKKFAEIGAIRLVCGVFFAAMETVQMHLTCLNWQIIAILSDFKRFQAIKKEKFNIFFQPKMLECGV